MKLFPACLVVAITFPLPAAAQAPPRPSLADAAAVLRAQAKIDLTHTFGPRTPVRPGFGAARFTPAVDAKTLEAFTIARDGFRATYHAMVGQYGTHVDAPAHVAPDGRYLDEIALDEMILPLADRGAVAIGHESLDTDASPTRESERAVLGGGHWQIEGMTNLDKVPATGAILVASWPKPERGLGFPARVYAIRP